MWLKGAHAIQRYCSPLNEKMENQIVDPKILLPFGSLLHCFFCFTGRDLYPEKPSLIDGFQILDLIKLNLPDMPKVRFFVKWNHVLLGTTCLSCFGMVF